MRIFAFAWLATSCVWISDDHAQQTMDRDGDGLAWPDDCDDADATLSEPLVWYADSDGDSYGNPAEWTTSCTVPSGHVADDTDCNDTDANAFPSALCRADA